MATNTIKAWVDGSVREIEVEVFESSEQELELNPAAIITSVNLLASNWEGSSAPYSQVVAISGVTPNSMIDFQPTPEQLAVWQDEGWAFTIVNDNGVTYAYVSGGKPEEDITVQVKVQEVITV